MKNKYKLTLLISSLLAIGVALSAFFATWHQKQDTDFTWWNLIEVSGSWFIVTAVTFSMAGALLVSFFSGARKLLKLGRAER